MQAVILVGGEGTRLRPLTLATPKPMVPLFGIPFLERTLARLRAAGVHDVVLAAGYLPRGITDVLGDGSRLGMRLNYRVEDSPLGTAGALRNVADLITGPFFVLNGDVLTSLDLGAMIAFHRQRGGMGVLHSIRVEDPSAFGCIVADETGRISRFVEKPPRAEAPTDVINAGTYLLERSVLDAIPAGRAVSIERETFPQLLAAGTPVYTFTTTDYWLDIGRPEQYLQAHDDVLAGKLALSPSPLDARVPAGVTAPSFVGDGTTLAPGAVVGPNAVVGDNCRIGAGASVLRSVIWNDVTVGDGATVDGAIVASGVRIGAGASLAPGAVIGHGVAIEAGASIPGDARISIADSMRGSPAVT